MLGLGDFDGDEGLEALFSSSEDKGYQPGDLILANWTPDGFSDFEVVASLDVDEGFHHSDVVHLNDDGLPDLVEGGKAYVSGLNFLYEVIDDQDYYLDSALVIAQVDDDDLSEAFDIVGDQDIYRYDFSREESVVVSRIATLPDDETLTGIGFHGVSKDILSFSRKHLTEGQGLDLHDEEWEVIVRAHLSNGNATRRGLSFIDPATSVTAEAIFIFPQMRIVGVFWPTEQSIIGNKVGKPRVSLKWCGRTGSTGWIKYWIATISSTRPGLFFGRSTEMGSWIWSFPLRVGPGSSSATWINFLGSPAGRMASGL